MTTPGSYTVWMRTDRLFTRNVQAGKSLEIFLIAAIASLLAVRYGLYLSGYPQVGGSTLHIAHMLWGGLLMLAALVLLLAFLGQRLQRFAALLGGAGFGIFIDEIGKFLTKDNNYFFKPAIGIIYAIFVILYLVASFFGRTRPLTDREAQLNALSQLEEAVLHDMDPIERQRVAALLQQADPKSPITKHLKTFLHTTDTVKPDDPNALERFLAALQRGYDWLWHRRGTNLAVRVFFIVEVVFFLAGVLYSFIGDLGSVADLFRGRIDYGRWLVIGQLVSSVVAFGFVMTGLKYLPRNRRRAFEWFRRSVMVNLLLTDFFIFSRIQFGAIGGFAFNIGLLLIINFVLHYENRRGEGAT